MAVIPPPLFREGLFLRPHHLQLEQRHREGMATTERTIAHPYSFGVFAFDIDSDKLRLPPGQRSLEFRRLYAVLPGSGRVVMFDINGDGNAGLDPLPLPDSLGAYNGKLQVWLAIPAWLPGRPNTSETATLSQDDMRTYYPVIGDANDENIGANSQPIVFRRIRAMLLSGPVGETPRGQFEFLPLVRLVDARDESRRGELILDPEYAPPSLTLSAYPETARQWELFARHVVGQRQVAENRVRPRFSLEAMTNAGWRRLFRLQILNAHAPKLLAMTMAPGVSIWHAWTELADMHGKLAGLYPEHMAWDDLSYDHMAPMETLSGVMRRIRSYLDAEEMPRCQMLDFRADPDGFLRCRLPEWPVEQEDEREFYLAVRSEGDQDTLLCEVTDGKRFKVLGVRDLSRQIFGVPLRHEAILPEDIPASRDMVLFRLQRDEKSSALWEAILSEGEMGISAVSRQNAEAAAGGDAGLLFSLVVITPPV